jgi:hypothetical protein
VDFDLAWFPSYQDVPPGPSMLTQPWTTPSGTGPHGRHCRYNVPYQNAVKRSLQVLHALTHYETAGIVAAPTTSLPEEFAESATQPSSSIRPMLWGRLWWPPERLRLAGGQEDHFSWALQRAVLGSVTNTSTTKAWDCGKCGALRSNSRTPRS